MKGKNNDIEQKEAYISEEQKMKGIQWVKKPEQIIPLCFIDSTVYMIIPLRKLTCY